MIRDVAARLQPRMRSAHVPGHDRYGQANTLHSIYVHLVFYYELVRRFCGRGCGVEGKARGSEPKAAAEKYGGDCSLISREA